MKVLEANIISVTLATPHICRVCFQEKVFTSPSTEESTSPVLVPPDVQVPYAIVKEGKEYLIISLFVTMDGQEVKIGTKTEEIYPAKDPKSLHISFDEVEGDLMTASVTISYRLQKLTVLGTITSPGGNTGISVVRLAHIIRLKN